jgi:nucleotidyltransferase substrate binding protein (TIGR01987 family)
LRAAGASAPSAAMASSNLRRWPIATTPISLRSSDVSFGSTSPSIAFARNAGSYWGSPKTLQPISNFHVRKPPREPIVWDSVIQRFEISFELFWRFLKAYLEEQHNASYTSPRTCFRSAFRHGVIDNDPFWIDLTVLRNYTVHTHNEQLDDYVYSQLVEQRFAPSDGSSKQRFWCIMSVSARRYPVKWAR